MGECKKKKNAVYRLHSSRNPTWRRLGGECGVVRTKDLKIPLRSRSHTLGSECINEGGSIFPKCKILHRKQDKGMAKDHDEGVTQGEHYQVQGGGFNRGARCHRCQHDCVLWARRSFSVSLPHSLSSV